MEFNIADWGMVLTDSVAPTTSPTHSPTDSPTTSQPTGNPSKSPTNLPTTSPTSLPTVSPTAAAPVTPSPTGAPITAAPVVAAPTNLAMKGLASADSECYNGFARKAIDGNADTSNHSCCNADGTRWLLVDLGKDTVNYIDEIVIKNRGDCCGGRLKSYFVEVLDAEKNVVWTSVFQSGWVGTGQVRTFTPDGGAVGRFARLRYEDSYKSCMHVAELEVWGYPLELPAAQPEIHEMALNRPTSATPSFNENTGPEKANDGISDTIYHSKCNDIPWWIVDLGVESFVQDVTITNRRACCGGRLRAATVAILDDDMNVVDARFIMGAVGNGQVVQKVFNEDTSFGRYVKLSFNRQDCLHMDEVAVNGYHTMAQPTAAPTPTLVDLSSGKPASQSSTFQTQNAALVVDGDDSTFSHTKCYEGYAQWWKVDLEGTYTIASVNMVNRQDCCGGRLHDFDILFLDGDMNVVESIFNSGGLGNHKTFNTGLINGVSHVKIVLPSKDCLQLGEVQVMGFGSL